MTGEVTAGTGTRHRPEGLLGLATGWSRLIADAGFAA